MQPTTLALDWTPNTNHIGFFVAHERGFYSELGLDVTILDPTADNYATTPAKKVELGEADFALCPLESIISYRTKSPPFALIAVAALLQDDLSAIAYRPQAGILRPSDLDGKTYASYHARYEDGIVRKMVQNDGGQGTVDFHYPAKLGIWETILNGKFDATWVFLNWEALREGEADKPSYFKMADYGVPYSYSPVIAANEARLQQRTGDYRKFLEASRRGFLFAQKYPLEATGILSELVAESDRSIDLLQSLEITSPYFGTADNWGRMAIANVDLFLDWLAQNGLEEERLAVDEIVSRALFNH